MRIGKVFFFIKDFFNFYFFNIINLLNMKWLVYFRVGIFFFVLVRFVLEFLMNGVIKSGVKVIKEFFDVLELCYIVL